MLSMFASLSLAVSQTRQGVASVDSLVEQALRLALQLPPFLDLLGVPSGLLCESGCSKMRGNVFGRFGWCRSRRRSGSRVVLDAVPCFLLIQQITFVLIKRMFGTFRLVVFGLGLGFLFLFTT